MTVYYHTAGRARERVMVYGGIGAGKSRGFLDIAKRALGPDDTAYIIDIDNSWDRLLDSEYAAPLTVREEWRGGVRDTSAEDADGQLVVHHVRGWEQTRAAIEKVWAAANRDDWICVDDATWMWSDVQSWYYTTTWGEELPEFLLAHRVKQIADKAKATQGQDAQLIEWNYINPLWVRSVAEPFVNTPCHLYVCAAAKEIRTDGRVKKEVSDLFGGVGYSPGTQWRLGGQMQTVLFLECTRTGRYKMTTIKDRERERVDSVEWDNMFGDYLRKVGGWKVARP